jgi:hypothetical protein
MEKHFRKKRLLSSGSPCFRCPKKINLFMIPLIRILMNAAGIKPTVNKACFVSKVENPIVPAAMEDLRKKSRKNMHL